MHMAVDYTIIEQSNTQVLILQLFYSFTAGIKIIQVTEENRVRSVYTACEHAKAGNKRT